MALVAGALTRELAERRNEFIEAAVSGASATTTLVADALAEYFTEDVAHLNAWVYCPATTGPNAANTGQSRRVESYQAAQHALLFYLGWPTAPVPNSGVQDRYYITTRTRWDRLRTALSAGVADLKMPFATPLVQDIQTVPNTYAYELPTTPGSIVPEMVSDLAVSVDDQASGMIGYPYAAGSPYNWTMYSTVDPVTGAPRYVLQLEQLPPEGHVIRLWGRSPFARFATDQALLLVSPQYEDAVQEYLFLYASYIMARWDLDTEPVGKAQYALALSEATIQRAKAQLLDLLPRAPNARVVVPGRGTGRILAHPDGNDADFLAAHHTLHAKLDDPEPRILRLWD